MTRRGRQTGFFATRSDLEPGLQRLDAGAGADLKYVPYLDPGPAPIEHRSLLRDVPDLGLARSDDHNTGHCYLVLHADAAVPVRTVEERGRVHHLIDLDRLPVAVLLRTGGVRGPRVLICGDVSTVGDSDRATEMQRTVARELTRGFQKLKGWLIGPEAARLLDDGWRLVTMSTRSPPGYDLRR